MRCTKREACRCPASDPLEPIVDARVEVPCANTGVEEVSCTDSRGAEEPTDDVVTVEVHVYPAPIMKWTRYLAPIEQWGCPAPILVEPTVDATAGEVPRTDNEVDEVPQRQGRYPETIMKWTRCFAPIPEWRRCLAPILVEPTVNAWSAEVPSTDNSEDDVPRTDRTVEVSCTDSHEADR